jgi:hypothetical protein
MESGVKRYFMIDKVFFDSLFDLISHYQAWSSLLVFKRFYRLDIKSVMLVFSTGFVKYCTSNLLSGLASPPPLPDLISHYQARSS